MEIRPEKHRAQAESGIERKGWKLTVYVVDDSEKTRMVVYNLAKICKEHLKDECHIDVVDLEIDPSVARKARIVAIPTVERTWPQPAKRIIGDVSNAAKVITGLAFPA
jgi:circadian clock protein KaiB